MKKRTRAIATALLGRSAAVLIGLLLAPAGANAQSSLLDAGVRADLLAKGTLSRAFRGEEPLLYAPKCPDGAALAGEASSFKPTVAVEVVRFIPAPQAAALRGETGRLGLVNALCAVGTMKGITYWSRSRNATTVLFKESYAVTSPQSLQRADDPVFSALPAQTLFTSVQEDSSFGRNVYQTTVINGTDGVRSRTENVSAVSFAFVTVIPKGGLVTFSLVIPEENGILFYGMAMIRSSFPLGNFNSRSESLSNRVVAVADWLKGRLGL